MKTLKDDLTKIIKGNVSNDAATRDAFSHDASMFELRPDVVVTPKDKYDIETVVKYVAKNKKNCSGLSVTVRSGGTDMSGGAINSSIVLNMTPKFNKIKSVSSDAAEVQPGVFYRDFEVETLKYDALLPSYPASRDLCTIGGMVANNSGGEKSLQYGKTEDFVTELEVVLADGKSYIIKPLNKTELDTKLKQQDFEGQLYRQVFDLVDKNYDEIKAAKPNVSKDSTGYHIWNIWDRKKQVFDLTRAIVGSQGTLGIVTNIKFRLVKAPKHSGTLVVFMKRIDHLGEFIVDVLKAKPATFEGFDNYTLWLSFKLFFYFRKKLGWLGMIKLGLQLLPSGLKIASSMPKMVLMIEFNGDSEEEVAAKVHSMRMNLSKYNHDMLFEEDETEAKSRKFWIMRRESFNLLRQKVKDKHTAPFIDDLIVQPKYLQEFLPQLRVILKKYKFLATIAGHFGDGNFHVIPLMKIEDPKELAKIEPAMKEVSELVMKYNGSLSGEHNDGMSRGPWLHEMYSPEVIRYFKQLKLAFDEDNIFNPHKKTDADWQYSLDNIRSHF